MNITRFFSLSLSEIEKYIKFKLPSTIKPLKTDPVLFSPAVKEGLDLSGVNNRKFKEGAHVVKKINLQGVYDIKAFITPPPCYDLWIIFTMSDNSKPKILQLILDSENIKISKIIYKMKVMEEEDLDKTMTLNDIMRDEHY